MERGEYLTKIMEEKGFNAMSLSKASGVPYTTIRSMIERNLNNASVDNVIKICKILEISVESLYKPKEGEFHPELTAKDERDIQKELEIILNDLNSQNSYAAFDGEVMDDKEEEDKELLKKSLEQSLILAKRLSKQKFTPKKYRK